MKGWCKKDIPISAFWHCWAILLSKVSVPLSSRQMLLLAFFLYWSTYWHFLVIPDALLIASMALSCLVLKSISSYCTFYLSSTDWPDAFITPELEVQHVLNSWSNLSSNYMCYLASTKRMVCISAIIVLSLRKCHSLLPFSFRPAFLGSCSHTSLCAATCLSECHWFLIVPIFPSQRFWTLL